MHNFYTTIGPLTLQTYTLLLALGISAGAALGAYRLRIQPGRVADVYLLALAGGIAGARVGHVALNWAHFASAPAEILRLNSGGLDWHGAVLGALISLSLGARWRGFSVVALLDSLVLALPLIALAGWLGCWAAGCAYGAEVDTLANHSPLVVSFMPDVYGIPAPRYHTQIFGATAALVLVLLAGLMVWRGWLVDGRFWLLLTLLSLLMFIIGFFRADYAVMMGGLRADQWLDLALLAVALSGAWGLRRAERASQ